MQTAFIEVVALRSTTQDRNSVGYEWWILATRGRLEFPAKGLSCNVACNRGDAQS